MNGYRSIKFVRCIVIIFCTGFLILPSLCFDQISTGKTNVVQRSNYIESTNENNDGYSFFSFAIIWGTFEIMWYKSWSGFHVYNPIPYNTTMSVIGWVPYEHKFIFKKSCDVTGSLHVGIIGKHSLFIVALGDITAW